MQTIWLLAIKDLKNETKGNDFFISLLSLILLFSFFFGIAFQSADLSADSLTRILPACSWFLTLIIASLTIERSFAYEFKEGGIFALTLFSSVSSEKFYIAKVMVNFLSVLTAHLIGFFALAIFLEISVAGLIIPFFKISIFIIIGFSSLSSFLAPISSRSNLPALLMPMMLIPLLFPLFLAAIHITWQLWVTHEIAWDSMWFSVVLGLDAIYFIFGINVFPYIIKD